MDYVSNKDNQQKTKTKEIIDNTSKFVKVVKTTFGGLDKDIIARKILYKLKQKSLVLVYIVEFQRYTMRTDHNNYRLMSFFYYRLKDTIKDKLYRILELDNNNLRKL